MRKTVLLFVLLSFTPGLSSSQIPIYSGSPTRIDTASSFIFIGDVQLRGTPEILIGREDNKNAVRALLKKISEEDPSFVLVLGDFTFPGSSLNSWQDFDDLAKPIRTKGIPIFPLPGNHEYFGNHNVAFTQYFSRFPQIKEQLWYSKKWKDIGIITLNSNFSNLSKDDITDERKWYLGEMKKMQADSSVAIIIVCCHQPPFTNSSVVNDDKDVQKYFVPSYIHTPKAKLFFSGHCHSYEHFKISGKDFIVSGGAGPSQRLEAPKKNSVKQDLFRDGPERRHHFCKLIRTADGLKVQMTQIDEPLKNWTIGEEIFVTSGK